VKYNVPVPKVVDVDDINLIIRDFIPHGARPQNKDLEEQNIEVDGVEECHEFLHVDPSNPISNELEFLFKVSLPKVNRTDA